MSERLRAGEPTRLADRADLDERGDFGPGLGSMVDDLRIARRAAQAGYDVDAGLARFSAMIAVAPGAAIGTAASSAAAPASGAAATGATAATGAAPTALGGSLGAAGSSGSVAAATKLAVATKVGFGLKALVATVIATGTIGVASYELASTPAARVEPAVVAVDARGRDPIVEQSTGRREPLPAEIEASRPRDEAPAPPTDAEKPSSAEVPTPSLSPSPSPTLSPTPTPSPSPSLTPSPTPTPTSLASQGPSTASSAPSSNASVVSSVKPEMDQLVKAQRASSAGDALQLAEEGHRLFPRGVFWQEREAVAIQALSRLGRGAEAAARARAFLARHPESAYAEQFRRIAGE